MPRRPQRRAAPSSTTRSTPGTEPGACARSTLRPEPREGRRQACSSTLGGRLVRAFAWGALALTLQAAPAAAQAEGDLASKAAAESLYREARELIEAGRTAEACPKLAESHRLDPAGGTVLLLARCYEETGKTASAWLRYDEALGYARAARRDDRVEDVQGALERLAPRLITLALVVPAEVAELPGLALTLDGGVLPTSVRRLPIDPGEHELTVTADGHEPWTTKITSTTDGETLDVQIPPLTPAAVTEPVGPVATTEPAPGGEPSDEGPPPGRGRRIVGYSAAGAGLALIGVGSYFGIQAIDAADEANAICPVSPCGDAAGVERNDDAKSAATMANVLIPVGAALSVGALVWALTAPKAERRAGAIELRLGPVAGGAFATASGRF